MQVHDRVRHCMRVAARPQSACQAVATQAWQWSLESLRGCSICKGGTRTETPAGTGHPMCLFLHKMAKEQLLWKQLAQACQGCLGTTMQVV